MRNTLYFSYMFIIKPFPDYLKYIIFCALDSNHHLHLYPQHDVFKRHVGSARL